MSPRGFKLRQMVSGAISPWSKAGQTTPAPAQPLNPILPKPPQPVSPQRPTGGEFQPIPGITGGPPPAPPVGTPEYNLWWLRYGRFQEQRITNGGNPTGGQVIRPN